ncbi:MAG TPA: hypothetical protein VFR01_00650, partial [Geobacterales bacterium]|nr:hypothetical protein [Geobacterales bacterium]
EDLAGLLGGFFFVEPEPATAVERIDQIIEERRDRLSEETFAVLHDLTQPSEAKRPVDDLIMQTSADQSQKARIRS